MSYLGLKLARDLRETTREEQSSVEHVSYKSPLILGTCVLNKKRKQVHQYEEQEFGLVYLGKLKPRKVAKVWAAATYTQRGKHPVTSKLQQGDAASRGKPLTWLGNRTYVCCGGPQNVPTVQPTPPP